MRDDILRAKFEKTHQPEGIRILEENVDTIEGVPGCTVRYNDILEVPYYVLVETREGELQANTGDWIFFDSEGEPYPIDHEEVMASYEVVEVLEEREDDES